MEQKFDFDKIGKRMPYTVPSGTFDDIEHNVADSLSLRKKKMNKFHLFRWSAGLAVAASIALLIVVRPTNSISSTTSDDMLTKIDLADADLSEADREYLIEIYNDDIFINQK